MKRLVFLIFLCFVPVTAFTGTNELATPGWVQNTFIVPVAEDLNANATQRYSVPLSEILALGVQATNSLISIATESPGANCTTGGIKVTSGLDDNDNGTLDLAEIDQTGYSCNGAVGADGLKSLISVAAESPGVNCVDGGQAVNVGVDDSNDGTLDIGEIDTTFYVCDGADGPVLSVNAQTGAVVLDADDIDDTATTHKWTTQTQQNVWDSALQPGDVVDSVKLNTAASVTVGQGEFAWNADEETADFGLNGATLQLGQELHYHVRNNTGVQINDGTPVMVTGTVGASSRITIAPMDGTNPANAKYFIGLTTEDIPNGDDGKVTRFGKIRGIDTTGWNDGDVLWISPSVVGGLTNIEPASGELGLPIAFVIYSSVSGTLFVRAESVDTHNIGTDSQTLSILGNDLTISGGNTVTIPSTGGTTDHAALSNLDYASSGHTGFATSAQGSLADSAVQPGDLGTAAAVNTGTTEGTVPLLGVGGALNISGIDLPAASDYKVAGVALNAGHVPTNTAGFDGVLSAAENTIQKALDKLDDTSYRTLKDFGAKGDGKIVAGLSMWLDALTLSSGSANLVQTDSLRAGFIKSEFVGRQVVIPSAGAGGAPLNSSIVSVLIDTPSAGQKTIVIADTVSATGTYGAFIGNAEGCAMTAGSAVITCTQAVFADTATDAGKAIAVEGVGGVANSNDPLVTTISTVQSVYSATLAATASTTRSYAWAKFGTDDADAIQAAVDWAEATKGKIRGTSGTYLYSHEIRIDKPIHFQGDGWGSTWFSPVAGYTGGWGFVLNDVWNKPISNTEGGANGGASAVIRGMSQTDDDSGLVFGGFAVVGHRMFDPIGSHGIRTYNRVRQAIISGIKVYGMRGIGWSMGLDGGPLYDATLVGTGVPSLTESIFRDIKIWGCGVSGTYRSWEMGQGKEDDTLEWSAGNDANVFINFSAIYNFSEGGLYSETYPADQTFMRIWHFYRPQFHGYGYYTFLQPEAVTGDLCKFQGNMGSIFLTGPWANASLTGYAAYRFLADPTTLEYPDGVVMTQAGGLQAIDDFIVIEDAGDLNIQLDYNTDYDLYATGQIIQIDANALAPGAEVILDIQTRGSFSLTTPYSIDATVAGQVFFRNRDRSNQISLPHGTTLPATCYGSELFFKTDAPTGKRLYGCESGTFVLQGDGVSGTPTNITDGDTSVVVSDTPGSESITATVNGGAQLKLTHATGGYRHSKITSGSDSRISLVAGDTDIAPRLQLISALDTTDGVTPSTSRGFGNFDYGSSVSTLSGAQFNIRYLTTGSTVFPMITADAGEGVMIRANDDASDIADADLTAGMCQLYQAEATNGVFIKCKESGGTVNIKEIGIGGAADLDGLSDVTISTPATNDILVKTPGAWLNLPVGGDLTMNYGGFTIVADSVALGTDTTGDFVSGATSAGGLVKTGTESATLGLITCTTGQILKYSAGWGCAADNDTGGTPTQIVVGDTKILASDTGTDGALTATVDGVGVALFTYDEATSKSIFSLTGSNYSSQFESFAYGDAAAYTNYSNYSKSRGTKASPTALSSGDVIMTTGIGGGYGAGTVDNPRTAMQVVTSEAWSATGAGFETTFWTRANGTAPGAGSTTKRLVIQNGGNIEITGLAGTYTNGSAYVCVNDSGVIYASESACP